MQEEEEEMDNFSQDILDLGFKSSMPPDSGNCEAILVVDLLHQFVTQSPVQQKPKPPSN